MKLVKETDSIIVFEEVPISVFEMKDEFPWEIFWWEMNVSDNLFKAVMYPKTKEQIKMNPKEFLEIDDIIDDDEVEFSFTLFFYKGGKK